MNEILPPVEPFPRWVEFWKARYSPKYGGPEDRFYPRLMADVQNAHDDATILAALKEIFRWKDGAYTRWQDQIERITFAAWLQLRASKAIPCLWPGGVVFDLFLQHVISNGKLPMIDRHAWRGYCHASGRKRIVKLAQLRKTGLNHYAEYSKWFGERVGADINPRHLDQALMAYGQHVSRKRRGHYC